VGQDLPIAEEQQQGREGREGRRGAIDHLKAPCYNLSTGSARWMLETDGVVIYSSSPPLCLSILSLISCPSLGSVQELLAILVQSLIGSLHKCLTLHLERDRDREMRREGGRGGRTDILLLKNLIEDLREVIRWVASCDLDLVNIREGIVDGGLREGRVKR
jgi:hypothetical protein